MNQIQRQRQRLGTGKGLFVANTSRNLTTISSDNPTPSPQVPTAHKNSNKWLYYLAAGMAVGGGVYYYSTSSSSNNRIIPSSYVPAFDGSWKEFKLIEKTDLNHNVARFRFKLPEGTTEVGLPTASAVVSKMKPNEGAKAKNIIRPYTPVEPDSPSGFFDLVVKRYDQGNMSKHIHSLVPGDVLEMKGPNLKWKYEPNTIGHIGMIAGGSGLTPMYQVLQKIANNPEDKTKVDLIFANVTPQDIFLKTELDAFAAKKPDQIKIHYSVDKAPWTGWSGPTGHVNEALLSKVMPKPSAGKVFICGPPPMLSAISGSKAKDFTQGEVGGLLKKMGYSTEDVFKF